MPLKQPPILQSSLCKFERASILFAAERYDEALAELEELKELVPKESPVYFLLGKVSPPIHSCNADFNSTSHIRCTTS